VVSRLRRERRRTALRPWLAGSAVAAAAALLVALILAGSRPSPSLVAELVDKHIAYAQIDRPAEFASADRAEVAEWFRTRAGLRIIVPDYSRSGIQLVGARLADAHERKAAYLLYEKGRTLLSVFMVPHSKRDSAISGTRVVFGGHEYVTHEWKGYRTVAWADGTALFGLVSMLDYDALLECADRLRAERASQAQL
jgi:anti-sigma factor RsiW